MFEVEVSSVMDNLVCFEGVVTDEVWLIIEGEAELMPESDEGLSGLFCAVESVAIFLL